MRPTLLAALTALLVTAAPRALAQDLRIFHFDVEQGDSTLIVSPDGHALLVDGGPTGTGTRRIVPRLRQLGVTHLDATVVTHYHEDHIGGLDEVVTSGFLPAVAYDRGDGTTDVTSTYLAYVGAVGTHRLQIRPGETIELGAEVALTCVCANGVTADGASAGVSSDEENESSVALVLRYRDFAYFIGGDITGGALGTKDVETLVAPLVRKIDAYHVSHHGSSTSSNQAFLDRTLPEVAIISCGARNSYGHPDQDVLDRLTALPSCAAIWTTNPGSQATSPKLIVAGATLAANDGEIVLETDGASGFSVNGVCYPLVADRAPPAITAGPSVTRVSGQSATIAWTTSEPAESFVELGFSASYGGAQASHVLTLAHSITVTGLAPQALYHFRAGSIDASGNGPTFSADGTLTTIAASAGVVVNEVAPQGQGADEWVELYNGSASAVDLTGWTITDNDAHTFRFPAFTLAARGYVVVTSATSGQDGPDARGVMTFQGGLPGRFGTDAVWNNPGDDIELRSAAGQTVDWVAYGSGAGIDGPPAGHWLSGAAYPAAPTSTGESIARWPNGADDNTVANWRTRATTRGVSNGGEPPPPPLPPRASAGLSVLGQEGTAVAFDGTLSAAASGATLTAYAWDFGDGSSGAGARPSHTYADSGIYEVTLVVTDSRGLSSESATTADIANLPPTPGAGGPYVAFDGYAVALAGSATDASPVDAATLACRWTFGDGSPDADGPSASHVFPGPGTYTVTLIVADKDGAEARATAVATINPLPPLRALLPAIASGRDGVGIEYAGASPEVVDLNKAGEPSAKLYVGGGAGSFFEARTAPLGPIWRVEAAKATVSYRMTSATWAGALRLELWSGGALLGTTSLARATTSTTVTWDIGGLVTPANAGGLSLRLVNTEPRDLKVIWSFAAVEVDAR